MMNNYKTLLVPVDFTIEALNTVKHALSRHTGEHVKLILLHSEHLNYSIPDLLFYSKYSLVEKLTTPAFEEALTILRNRYESNLRILVLDVFHGLTASAYTSFAQSRKVDLAYIPRTYRLKTIENSFDPTTLIKRSGLPYIEVEWSITDKVTDQEQLNILFNPTTAA